MAPNYMKLDSNWLAARASDVQWTGFELTTTHPPTSPPKLPWMPAAVPGTVLGTLLKNNLIPDPFYGLENEHIIDIADSGRGYYTFWFCTEFSVPLSGNERAWLQFRGINYQGDVYFNGHLKQLPKGMFQRHVLDVTDWINPNGQNHLAVCVYPPDHPGRIPPQGGQGGDHEIAKDVATQYVEGWDWMAPIRDRNTGIWDEVSIYTTGPVKLSDPHLVSSFFDNFKRVYLHSSVELTNTSSKPVFCTIKMEVQTEPRKNLEHVIEQELTLPGEATILFTFPQVFFYKPELWWPNGMGKQTLHKVSISLAAQGYKSDSWTHLFGFRKIENFIDPSTGGRLFRVNGEPIFIRGGNWIVSDGLLRLSKERYKSDIDLHADMNFNMIRCWGGGITERPEFYENCDRRGLLVWQEFWITGDNNGRGASPPSNPEWPLDHRLFLDCAKDTIKLLRNFTSLALWVGGNEQHPAKDLNEGLMDFLRLHPYFKLPAISENAELHKYSSDPSSYLDGTRVYIQGSLWDGFAKDNGDFSDGPYVIQNPEDFFKDSFYAYGFNPEVGSVGVPVAATMKATMPPEAWQIPDFIEEENGYLAEVPNPTWQYHKYIAYSDPGKVHDQIVSYGKPKDLDGFCEKAQLVNYVQYRALMEGWTSRMWTKYTGVLIWKNQNPWTGLRGQFYDHLHDQTGGFFGVRSACEPIHIQLNLDTYYVEAINTTSVSLEDVSVDATVWGLDGSMLYHQSQHTITVSLKKTLPVFEVSYASSNKDQPVYFVLLKLFSSSGQTLLSRNFYWLHLPGGSFKALEAFRSQKVPLRLGMKSTLTGKNCQLQVAVENPSQQISRKALVNQGRKEAQHTSISSCLWSRICPCFTSKVSKLFPEQNLNRDLKAKVAFWLQLSVVHMNEAGHEVRILPVSYSQNYFSLVPGERMDIAVSFEVPDGVTSPYLKLSGWNFQETKLSLSLS
ncbi:hypothetical protein L7F22_035854 [Adiantum nelumboides]|nr:hypothetical protein [Adiantum nelumboides]